MQQIETTDIRGVYAAITKLKSLKPNIASLKDKNGSLKDKNGSVLTTADQQVKRWKEFFEDNTAAEKENEELSVCSRRRNPIRHISTMPPTEVKVKRALQKLKNSKVAGPDSVPADLLKYGADIIGLVESQNTWRVERARNYHYS